MSDFVTRGTRRIDALKESLQGINMNNVVMMIFSSNVEEIQSVEQIPGPCGATRVDFALDKSAKFSPRQVILVSDGEPTCLIEDAFAAGQRLGCPINTIFVGDPLNFVAIDFLKKLSALTGGISGIQSLAEVKQLTTRITGLLSTSTTINTDDFLSTA